jgi:hypothetical protein
MTIQSLREEFNIPVTVSSLFAPLKVEGGVVSLLTTGPCCKRGCSRSSDFYRSFVILEQEWVEVK